MALHARTQEVLALAAHSPDCDFGITPDLCANITACAVYLHHHLMKLPPPFSWFYEAWMEFSKVLGLIMSKIILTILWIIGFGIYGIISRIVRASRREAPTGKSFWIDVEPVKSDDLHHQF